MTFIGRPVPRLEDRALLSGRGRFAADMALPQTIYMQVVRSAHSHATILSVDTDAARAAAGVIAVWTAQDIAEVPPIDFRTAGRKEFAPYRQPILARDRLRYVGEPI